MQMEAAPMQPSVSLPRMAARCVVCRGDIHDREPYEVWEGGFYCERHSLPYLRERARRFADLRDRQTADHS